MDDPRMMGSIPLPLNLIALIISYLERPADLGRVCRTSRLFYYLSLPQLYTNVSLRSYDHIRYCEQDGRPEGCGMASPFSMGLNGLVSRNVAGYVRSFGVCGEWKEYELHEHAKVGRVPDGSMMLNSLVRAAMERMVVLDSFSWELNTKMLPTIWQCLAQKVTLTKLTVKFPSKRHPRPLTVVPPIPSLQSLKIFDIDPLCYADDISNLLLGSKNLRHLTLHWSPRMREAREPSVHPSAYFGKCEAANCTLTLRSIAIQNLYTHSNDLCGKFIDNNEIEEVVFLNSTGGFGDDGSTAFLDHAWRHNIPPCIMPKLRMLRIDKLSHQQCAFLGCIQGLEKLYLLGPQAKASNSTSNGIGTTHSNSNSDNNAVPTLPHSPASSTSSPGNSDPTSILALKDNYLSTITKNHGSTLRHLLLPPQWRLSDNDIAMVVRQCPNLEQLAIGTELANFSHLRLLIPFLPNLIAIRLLGNPEDPAFLNKMRELDTGLHEMKIGEETVNREWSKLQWMELGGADLIFWVGPRYLHGTDDAGKAVWRRPVRKRCIDDVKRLEIWSMDSLDI